MDIIVVVKVSGADTLRRHVASMMVGMGTRLVVIVGWNITCSRRNGGAGYFRGLCRALARRRHDVVFLQPQRAAPSDLPEGEPYPVLEYQCPRDIPGVLPDFGPEALVIKYVDSSPEEPEVMAELLQSGAQVWLADGDAADTLARATESDGGCLRDVVPLCAGVLLVTGGPSAMEAYRQIGARTTRSWFAAADPLPREVDRPAFDLLFVGNRDPARDSRVGNTLLGLAHLRPRYTIGIAGEGWEALEGGPSIRLLGHCRPEMLPEVYRSARVVLNLTRDTLRKWGFCPSVRLFEASAARVPIITDGWPGLEMCFAPGREVLVAEDAAALAETLDSLDERRARALASAAYARLCAEHTWEHRLSQFPGGGQT